MVLAIQHTGLPPTAKHDLAQNSNSAETEEISAKFSADISREALET